MPARLAWLPRLHGRADRDEPHLNTLSLGRDQHAPQGANSPIPTPQLLAEEPGVAGGYADAMNTPGAAVSARPTATQPGLAAIRELRARAPAPDRR